MTPETYETILYDVEDRTATITFNRPEKLNAISRVMEKELADAYARAETDDDVWTIVITATGRAFCTGADVDTVRDDGKVPFDGRYLSRFHEWDAPQEATPPVSKLIRRIGYSLFARRPRCSRSGGNAMSARPPRCSPS